MTAPVSTWDYLRATSPGSTNADERDPNTPRQPGTGGTRDPDTRQPDKPPPTIGAMVLLDCRQTYQGAIDYMRGMYAVNDHPGVLALLRDLQANCRECITQIEAAFAEHFPDADLHELTR